MEVRFRSDTSELICKNLEQMADSIESIGHITQQFLDFFQFDNNLDSAFITSTTVIALLRDISGIILYLFHNSTNFLSVKKCMKYIAQGVREGAYKMDNEQYERYIISNNLHSELCSDTFQNIVLLLREHYGVAVTFFERQNVSLEATAALGRFIERVFEPLAELQFHSFYQLLLITDTSDTSLDFNEYESHLCRYNVSRCLSNSRIYKSLHPFHKKNIHRTIILGGI